MCIIKDMKSRKCVGWNKNPVSSPGRGILSGSGPRMPALACMHSGRKDRNRERRDSPRASTETGHGTQTTRQTGRIVISEAGVRERGALPLAIYPSPPSPGGAWLSGPTPWWSERFLSLPPSLHLSPSPSLSLSCSFGERGTGYERAPPLPTPLLPRLVLLPAGRDAARVPVLPPCNTVLAHTGTRWHTSRATPRAAAALLSARSVYWRSLQAHTQHPTLRRRAAQQLRGELAARHTARHTMADCSEEA